METKWLAPFAIWASMTRSNFRYEFCSVIEDEKADDMIWISTPVVILLIHSGWKWIPKCLIFATLQFIWILAPRITLEKRFAFLARKFKYRKILKWDIDSDFHTAVTSTSCNDESSFYVCQGFKSLYFFKRELKLLSLLHLCIFFFLFFHNLFLKRLIQMIFQSGQFVGYFILIVRLKLFKNLSFSRSSRLQNA